MFLLFQKPNFFLVLCIGTTWPALSTFLQAHAKFFLSNYVLLWLSSYLTKANISSRRVISRTIKSILDTPSTRFSTSRESPFNEIGKAVFLAINFYGLNVQVRLSENKGIRYEVLCSYKISARRMNTLASKRARNLNSDA